MKSVSTFLIKTELAVELINRSESLSLLDWKLRTFVSILHVKTWPTSGIPS